MDNEDKIEQMLDQLRSNLDRLLDRIKYCQMCNDSLEERVTDIEEWLKNGTVPVETDFDLD